MSIFTTLSKKEQVAETIKDQILAGKTPAGTKLDSIRDLAGKFSVSTKVVLDAFNILEKERFIYREVGRGVFVGRCTEAAAKIEVCILGYGVDMVNDTHFSNLMQIAVPPQVRKEYNFSIRSITSTYDMDSNNFKDELSKMERYMNPDCILLNIPMINKAQFKAVLNLKTPIIFVGDFSDARMNSLSFHQVAGNSVDMGRKAVKNIVEKEKCRKLGLLSGSKCHFFNHEFCRGVQDEADKQGVILHYIEFPRGIAWSIPDAKRKRIYKENFATIKQQELEKLPWLIAGLRQDHLLESIQDNGIKLPRLYKAVTTTKAMPEFYEAIYSMIDHVIAKPNHFKKVTVANQLTLEHISC